MAEMRNKVPQIANQKVNEVADKIKLETVKEIIGKINEVCRSSRNDIECHSKLCSLVNNLEDTLKEKHLKGGKEY